MDRSASLAVLLSSLAWGCQELPYVSHCPEPEEEGEAIFTPTEEELASALDEEGELTEDGCAELCRSYAPAEVVRVEACGPADDTGAEEGALSCAFVGTPLCIGGRGHRSIRELGGGRGREAVGAWLASSAEVEAASVKAFASIAIELCRFGAPEELVERARSALRDEVRHARLLGNLAACRGASPGRPSFSPTPERTLLAFAVENRVEGCVRETWAALVAHRQAIHASDPEIAAAFARIAIDESRHAELAGDIDRWALARLGSRDRAEVERAGLRAIAALSEFVEPDPDLEQIAGLPSAGAARRLLQGLEAARWGEVARAA